MKGSEAAAAYDAHLHLQDHRIASCAEKLWLDARAQGVRGGICCATHPDDWDRTASICAACPGLTPAFGVHPAFAASLPPDWREQLEARLRLHPGAPVGEIGLDGRPRGVDHAVQRAIFESQLQLAATLGRPVVVHAVHCWSDLPLILRAMSDRVPGIMIHAWSGSGAILSTLCRHGMYLSFGGAVTDPRHRRARACAQQAPRDNLLAETDCPDAMPVGGSRLPPPADPALNPPTNLDRVVQALAHLRGEPTDELAAYCTRNAERFLNP